MLSMPFTLADHLSVSTFSPRHSSEYDEQCQEYLGIFRGDQVRRQPGAFWHPLFAL